MKKTLKTILGIGVLIIAGVVVVKTIRKETKKLEKEEKKIDESLNNLGLSKKKVEEDDEPDDKNNFVKALYKSIEFGTLDGDFWDRDLINIHSENGVLDSDNVIHVIQSDTSRRGKLLEFYFEIPYTAYNDDFYKYPKIRDYEKTFVVAAKYMANNIVKSKLPIWEFAGFYIVNYKIRSKSGETRADRLDKNGNPIVFQKQIRIPKKDYFQVKNEDEEDKGESLFKLIEHVKTLTKGIISNNREKKLEVRLYDSSLRSDEECYDFKLEIPLLMFRISFHIEDSDNECGINIEKALRCIKYLTEEIKVTTNKWGGYSTVYERLMFHSKSEYPEEGFDFLRYYTVDIDDISNPKFEKRKIISETLIYEGEK